MQEKQYLITDHTIQTALDALWDLRGFLSEEQVKAASDRDKARWDKLDNLSTTVELVLHRLNRIRSEMTESSS
jgi:hypothetical protein